MAVDIGPMLAQCWPPSYENCHHNTKKEKENCILPALGRHWTNGDMYMLDRNRYAYISPMQAGCWHAYAGYIQACLHQLNAGEMLAS